MRKLAKRFLPAQYRRLIRRFLRRFPMIFARKMRRSSQTEVSESKVFGIGLSKTGTTSLSHALQVLGYRTATYSELSDLKLKEWFEGNFHKDYLISFDAATDTPIGVFFRELDRRYPGSKFVLTIRDEDEWIKSVERQFTKRDSSWFGDRGNLATYGYSKFNESEFRRRYVDHVESVRSHFTGREHDFLELNLFQGEGWPELCKFLGSAVPEGLQFPNVKPGTLIKSQDLIRSNRAPNGRRESARYVRAENSVSVVTPVVFRTARHVGDFDRVDALLQATCQSVSNLSDPRASHFTVAGYSPSWARTIENLWVLNMASSKILNHRYEVTIDKGLKTFVGLLLARVLSKPDVFIHLDGDDYLKEGLMPLLLQEAKRSPEIDILYWTQGVEVEIRWDGRTGITYESPRIMNAFHTLCGSSRAFTRSGTDLLLDRMAPYFPETISLIEEEAQYFSPGVNVPSYDFIKKFDAESLNLIRSKDNVINAFGRHGLDQTLNNKELDFVGSAKSVNHGEHDLHHRTNKQIKKSSQAGHVNLQSFGISPLNQDKT